MKGYIPTNQFALSLALILGLALFGYLFILPSLISSICPECPECPPCDECPDCICTLDCPEECNISDEDIKKMQESFPELKCIPTPTQNLALFSILTAAISILLSALTKKDLLAEFIASVAYLAVMFYMATIGYFDYAVYGTVIFFAVMITKYFIQNENESHK